MCSGVSPSEHREFAEAPSERRTATTWTSKKLKFLWNCEKCMNSFQWHWYHNNDVLDQEHFERRGTFGSSAVQATLCLHRAIIMKNDGIQYQLKETLSYRSSNFGDKGNLWFFCSTGNMQEAPPCVWTDLEKQIHFTDVNCQNSNEKSSPPLGSCSPSSRQEHFPLSLSSADLLLAYSTLDPGQKKSMQRSTYLWLQKRPPYEPQWRVFLDTVNHLDLLLRRPRPRKWMPCSLLTIGESGRDAWRKNKEKCQIAQIF